MFVRWFSYGLGVAVVMMGASLGYMAGDRKPPLDIAERTVLETKVRPGGFLEQRIRLTERKRCFLHSDRMIFDSNGERHLLPPVEFQAGIGLKLGEEQEYIIKIPVPYKIPFGPAKYTSSTVFRCNLLHWIWPIYAPYSEVRFEVVPL